MNYPNEERGVRRGGGRSDIRPATRTTADVACGVIALLVALLLSVVQAPPAWAAPPTNDAFADAVVLGPALPVSVEMSTVDATKEPGEPDHAGSPVGQTVWFSWTPEVSTLVEAGTCRGPVTAVGVYSGDAVDALTEVVSDDGSHCDGSARAIFTTTAGQTYRIAVDSDWSSPITLTIRESNPPANDDFADAATLAGTVPMAIAGTNVDATREPAEPDHAGQAGGHSVWWRWTPAEPGRVVVDTCTSSFDTVLVVYRGAAVDALTEVARNDNSFECPQSTGQSKLILDAVAGETYLIAVDGSFSRSGSIALHVRAISGPANDDFADAAVLGGGLPIEATGSNIEATEEPGEPDHGGRTTSRASIWYRWTPERSGPVEIDTCDSTIDRILGVYTGDAVDALTPIAPDSSRASCGGQTDIWGALVFDAVAGTTYHIAVDGPGTDANALRIRVATPPANDDFADAVVLTGDLPIENRVDTYDASKEFGEPDHAGERGGASVWFSWTAAASGTVAIETCKSFFSTVLGVYTGDAVDALTLVAANMFANAADCARSRVTVNAVAGTTYRIAVDGRFAETGSATLMITPATSPANDAFAAAQVMTGTLPLTVSASNVNATVETGEPNHGGLAGGRSVWFTWTAGTTGITVIETCGSSFDTLLAAYTGDALHSVTPVAANDDAGECGSTGSASRIRFEAEAGQPYRLVVDGYRGASGSMRLTIRPPVPPPNDAFANAHVLDGDLPLSASSTNLDATRESGEPNHAGVTGSASVWFRWTPSTSGRLLVDACGNNLSWVLGVYTGSAVDALTPVAADSDGCATIVDAVAGTTYSIAVDGRNGSVGAVFLGMRSMPMNDALADAQVLEDSRPITVTANNGDASRELGEPSHGSTSLWYRWTPTDVGSAVRIDTCAAAFDTVLSVYTGTAVNALTPVASSIDGCGTGSRVVFTPIAGESYAIAVASAGSGRGDFTLTLRDVRPPPNDDFAGAIAVEGVLPIIVGGTNADASAESGEPAHGGFPATSSVWYRWTPTLSGTTVIDLCPSDFDSIVAVYTGNSVNGLTTVASDDDGCEPGGPSVLQFDAVEGETYTIAVDGWRGAAGTITLGIRIPPANDDWAEGEVLTGTLPIRASGSVVDAGAEADEPGNGWRSVWYRWTPTADVHAAVEVCGAWRTLVTVYDASSLEPVGHVSRSTNPSPCGTGEESRWVFDARAGATYLVAVDAADRAGEFALTLRESNPPANDDFGDATDLGSSLPVSVEGSNAEASLEPGEPAHGPFTGGESIWYRWTAPASEPIVVDTCGDYWADSAVVVYTGDADDALTAVEATLQWCGSGWKRQLDAVAGTTYRIAVDTYFDTGAVPLTIRRHARPVNDTFASPTVLPARLPVTATGTTVDATREAGESHERSIWYEWTPNQSGPVVVELCGSAAFPSVTVETGTAVHDLDVVTIGNNECGDERAELDAVAGQTYRMAVDGGTSEGTVHLTMRWAQPPANDDFAGAVDLGRKKLPIDVRGTNVDATLEPSEEAPSYWTGSTVWYRWTATSTRLVTVETCGSTVDTELAVVQGTALDALDLVADNEDGCGGQQSRVMFSAAADETYLFQVGAVFGTEGDIRLRLRDANRPANDDIAEAQLLDGGVPITVTGSTVDATKEAGELDHGFVGVGMSVWYRWTAPASGSVVVDLCDTEHAAGVGVYQGAELPLRYPLVEARVTCESPLRFHAIAGETYRIAVDAAPSSGAIRLTLAPVPANDDISAATILDGALPIELTTSNRFATEQAGEPDHAGGVGQASLWYRWTPATSGPIVIDTCGSRIPTLLAVYTGQAINRMTEIGSDAGSCGGRSRVRFDAVAGQTYWLALDGADRARGDLRLSVEGVDTGDLTPSGAAGRAA